MKRRYPLLARTYLVAWDDDLIVKAGFTTHPRRYRAFELRGARIVAVASLRRGSVALEIALETHLGRRSARRAFHSKTAAQPYLGSGGAGYMECHRFADRATYDDALAECVSMMRAHVLDASPTRSCTDGRTNELTENVHTSASILTFPTRTNGQRK